MKKVTFEGWKNCIEMTSGDFRIIITTEIGPRVMGGFVGNSANIFNVDPERQDYSGYVDGIDAPEHPYSLCIGWPYGKGNMER